MIEIIYIKSREIEAFSFTFVKRVMVKVKFHQSVTYDTSYFLIIFLALTIVDLLIPVILTTSLYECLERSSTAISNSLSLYFLGRPSLKSCLNLASSLPVCVLSTIMFLSNSATASLVVKKISPSEYLLISRYLKYVLLFAY